MKISELKDDLISLGLEDNIGLAELLDLAVIARNTPYKISVLVSGPAGLGKSHLAKTVLDLFPTEDIITTSRMTPASLVRQGDLRDKVLFIYEKFEDQQFAQYIRELITEGEVNYSTANGDYKLLGPTTLIETTANSEIFGIENRSRCFVGWINMSQRARDNIQLMQKAHRTMKGYQFQCLANSLKDKHREFQKGLDRSITVDIPYAEEIQFNANVYHAPRILARVLNLISIVAYFQQQDRDVKTRNGNKYIEASKEDFLEAKNILISAHVEEDDLLVPRDVLEFIESLRGIRRELSQSKTFSRKQVETALSENSLFRKYKVVAKYLRTLASLGFVNELPVRGLKNRVDYAFAEDFPAGSSDSLVRNCYSTLSIA
ncbi:MAG: hypothetical protein PHS46_06875 [Candidatus Omnitrophica bacterium]|nr:hypothetical protein [Candidatus Omnitrophota bacterium]